MNKSNIGLNFLEITPKDFDVIFYWKKLELVREEDKKKYYIRNIKILEGDEKFEKVAIVFEEKVDFEKKIVSQKFNIDLTKKYLLFGLTKKTDNLERYDTRKDKYNRIYLVLNTHKEGVETVWLEPYFLSRTGSFGVLLDFRFFVDDDYKKLISSSVDRRVLQITGTLTNSGKTNKERYIFKYEKIQTFFNKFYQEIKTFQINSQFHVSEKLIELRSFLLNPKIYIFGNEKENKSPYFGLQNNPPLQSPSEVTRFVFIFKINDRNTAIDLLRGLKGESFPQQFSGIESLFGIQFNNDNITGKKVEFINEKVLEELIIEIKDSPDNVLPIILTNSKTNKEDEKIYYKLKHMFTSNNIPCQVVTKDLVNNSYSLKYSLSNIGLQLFAKAGGKPWKIKPATNNCLIIGIGSKNKETYIKGEDLRYTKKTERYFTYSVLTDSSGLFKEIQVLSDDKEEGNYYSKLVTNLNLIIRTSIEEGNKSIVVHSPYKISKEKVWDKIFKKLPKEVTISVIIINDRHKYFGFDFAKNSLVPYESTSLAISEKEYLVWFEGLQFNNSAFSKSIGSPIYINFWHSNKLENLKDLSFRKQLLQDCINLSGANWRGFKAKQLPVSIFYCQKISEFLTKFEEYNLEDIQIDNLKPWFL